MSRKEKNSSRSGTFDLESTTIYNQPFERVVLFYASGALDNIVKEFGLMSVFSKENSDEPLTIKAIDVNITQYCAMGILQISHPLIPCILEFGFDFRENTTDYSTLVKVSIKSIEERFDENIDKGYIQSRIKSFIEFFLVSFSVQMKKSTEYLIQTESEIIKGNREKIYDLVQSLELMKGFATKIEIEGDEKDIFKPGNIIKVNMKEWKTNENNGKKSRKTNGKNNGSKGENNEKNIDLKALKKNLKKVKNEEISGKNLGNNIMNDDDESKDKKCKENNNQNSANDETQSEQMNQNKITVIKDENKNENSEENEVIHRILDRNVEPGRLKWTIKEEISGKNIKSQVLIKEFIKLGEDEIFINLIHIFKEPITNEQMKELKLRKKIIMRRLKSMIGQEEEEEMEEEDYSGETEEEEEKKSVSKNEAINF